jgi:hypothetical protein
MKKAGLLSFALLLAACHEEPTMTFGLEVRYRESSLAADQALSWCRPPGDYHGAFSSTSIDDWDIGEPPPHLFLETDPDAKENVYRVRVYVVSEPDAEGFFTKPSAVLIERDYDSKFGEGGLQDSFVVDFNGEPYTVDVQGIPPESTCP